MTYSFLWFSLGRTVSNQAETFRAALLSENHILMICYITSRLGSQLLISFIKLSKYPIPLIHNALSIFLHLDKLSWQKIWTIYDMFLISSLFCAAQSSSFDVQKVFQPKIKVNVIVAANTFPYPHQHQVCDVPIDRVCNSGMASGHVGTVA